MKYVNRCVLTLKPRAPFIAWASSIGENLPEDWSLEGGSYFLDEQETEEALTTDIEKLSEAILENEFSVWTDDQVLWPKQRDYSLLTDYFDLHISVAGFDLGKESLLRADIADIDVF